MEGYPQVQGKRWLKATTTTCDQPVLPDKDGRLRPSGLSQRPFQTARPPPLQQLGGIRAAGGSTLVWSCSIDVDSFGNTVTGECQHFPTTRIYRSGDGEVGQHVGVWRSLMTGPCRRCQRGLTLIDSYCTTGQKLMYSRRTSSSPSKQVIACESELQCAYGGTSSQFMDNASIVLRLTH